MILLIIVVKFKGVHASTGASIVEGHQIIRSDHQVQAPTAEERAAQDMVRAAEALKQGIIYYPSYSKLDSIRLKWKDLDCLKLEGVADGQSYWILHKVS
jgi:hypothetical protein